MRNVMDMAVAAVTVFGLAATGAAFVPGPAPDPRTRADFFVEVTNHSPYRVEIRVSYSPNQSRRMGRVPANATRRLKGNWRDQPFVLVVTAFGAGAFENAAGGAQDDDAVLYTDLMTVDEDGQVELEIPTRLPGPNLRTQRP